MAQFVIRQSDFDQVKNQLVQRLADAQRVRDSIQQPLFYKSVSLTQQKVEQLQQALARCVDGFIELLSKLMAFLETIRETFETVDMQLSRSGAQ